MTRITYFVNVIKDTKWLVEKKKKKGVKNNLIADTRRFVTCCFFPVNISLRFDVIHISFYYYHSLFFCSLYLQLLLLFSPFIFSAIFLSKLFRFFVLVRFYSVKGLSTMSSNCSFTFQFPRVYMYQVHWERWVGQRNHTILIGKRRWFKISYRIGTSVSEN